MSSSNQKRKSEVPKKVKETDQPDKKQARSKDEVVGDKQSKSVLQSVDGAKSSTKKVETKIQLISLEHGLSEDDNQYREFVKTPGHSPGRDRSLKRQGSVLTGSTATPDMASTTVAGSPMDPSQMQLMFQNMCQFFNTNMAKEGHSLEAESVTTQAQVHGSEGPSALKRAKVGDNPYSYEEEYEEYQEVYPDEENFDDLTLGELSQRLELDPNDERRDLMIKLKSLLEVDDPSGHSAEYLKYSEMIKQLKGLLKMSDSEEGAVSSPKPRSAVREPLTPKDTSDVLPLSDLVRLNLLKKHSELVGNHDGSVGGLLVFPCRSNRGQFLKAAQFPAKYYKIESDPISHAAGKIDHDFNTLWSETQKDPTHIRTDCKSFTGLETASRRSLITMSHLEWFATGISTIFDALTDSDPPLSEENVKLVSLGRRLTSSIGRISETVVEEQSQILSTTILARRDASLFHLKEAAPPNVKTWLRNQPFLQQASLFGKVSETGAPLLESHEKRSTNLSMIGAFEALSKPSKASNNQNSRGFSQRGRGPRGSRGRARGSFLSRGGKKFSAQSAEPENFQGYQQGRGQRGRGLGSRPNRGGRSGFRGARY